MLGTQSQRPGSAPHFAPHFSHRALASISGMLLVILPLYALGISWLARLCGWPILARMTSNMWLCGASVLAGLGILLAIGWRTDEEPCFAHTAADRDDPNQQDTDV